MFYAPLMLQVNLPVVDTTMFFFFLSSLPAGDVVAIYNSPRKFVMGVKIKATGESKLMTALLIVMTFKLNCTFKTQICIQPWSIASKIFRFLGTLALILCM